MIERLDRFRAGEPVRMVLYTDPEKARQAARGGPPAP
jgi:hypothetical protein